MVLYKKIEPRGLYFRFGLDKKSPTEAKAPGRSFLHKKYCLFIPDDFTPI
jgi:hypothetical protein